MKTFAIVLLLSAAVAAQEPVNETAVAPRKGDDRAK